MLQTIACSLHESPDLLAPSAPSILPDLAERIAWIGVIFALSNCAD